MDQLPGTGCNRAGTQRGGPRGPVSSHPSTAHQPLTRAIWPMSAARRNRHPATAPNEHAGPADSTEQNTIPLTKQNRPMIVVTRLNGTRFAVNPDLIERIHESPDTHLVTLDGAAYVVLESLAEVVELIADYRAYILSKARDFPAITGYPLSLVPADTDDDLDGAGPTAPLHPRK